VSDDDVHALAAQKLRRINQRYTSGRRVLVDALAGADRPLTIPEIVEQPGTLATSSVYRNLATLEQAGVASRIVTSGEHARFELSEQFGEHHHHLVCLDCGAVSDFTLPPGVERSLDQALRRTARKWGYRTDSHRLDLAGTCPDCQRAS
jgi:Fe2+ or Zn2+ uptake regulation protein